jgi:hypothetical protein
MEEGSVKSNGAQSQRRGRNDFTDLYFARESSKSKEHNKPSEHLAVDRLESSLQTETEEKDVPQGPYSSSKQNHLYGMTLDKYFGGNFKTLNLEREGRASSGSKEKRDATHIQGGSSQNNIGSPKESAEERHNYQACGMPGFLGHSRTGSEHKSEEKKKRMLNTSNRFESQEKIYEEEGEIETSSYEANEDFAIEEEEEDLDLSIEGGGRPLPTARAFRSYDNMEEEIIRPHGHKFQEKRVNKFLNETKNEETGIGQRLESSEKEVREHSIKERIEKKYKIHKKTHGTSMCMGQFTNQEGGGNRKKRVKIDKEEESKGSNLNLKKQGARKMAPQKTYNSLQASRFDCFDARNSLYNPNKTGNPFTTFSTRNGFGQSGGIKTSKQQFHPSDPSGISLPSGTTFDPNRQTFYEKQMEMMRKTNLNKFNAEKNRTDELLRAENEDFINKYTAKFNLSQKETRALAMPLY